MAMKTRTIIFLTLFSVNRICVKIANRLVQTNYIPLRLHQRFVKGWAKRKAKREQKEKRS